MNQMKKSSTFRRLMSAKATPLLIILIVLMLITMVLSSNVLHGAPIKNMFTTGFMTPINWMTNFYGLVIQILMCAGLSCALISGNMDLSIAAQATLGAMIFAMLCYSTALPLLVIVVITIALSVAFGMVNTILVNVFKFPSFIATIGMSSVYGGLTYLITGGNNYAVNRPGVLWLGAKKFFGILPLTFIIAIVILLGFEFMLRRTVFGRYIYMCGGNPVAARLAGLNPNRMRMWMFLSNSILSVMGGVFWTAQAQTASPSSITSSAPNMTATAAAILGGVSFFGGTGTLFGPLVALVLINVLENMLDILGMGPYWIVFFQGVLLLLALFIDYVSLKKKEADMVKAALSK